MQSYFYQYTLIVAGQLRGAANSMDAIGERFERLSQLSNGVAQTRLNEGRRKLCLVLVRMLFITIRCIRGSGNSFPNITLQKLTPKSIKRRNLRNKPL
jgi:hypothetical protein